VIGDSRTKPMEILLVEDGLTDARITILALRRSQVHHRLTLVRTVQEAILFFKREGIFARAPQPDLMMLDMMLPDGSGIDILEAITGLQTGGFRTTTVVLTASADDALKNRCAELNVHDYISKPVKENEFMRVVREHKRLMIHSTQLLTEK
jgi:two-component system, chemotaxis family, response regulator Rcp1